MNERFRNCRVTTAGSIDEIRALDPFARPLVADLREIPQGCNVFVRGWALAPAPNAFRLPESVAFTYGPHATYAPLGRPRPDIAAAFGEANLAAAGFTAILPLRDCAPGELEIRAYAVDERGEPYGELGGAARIVVLDSRELFPKVEADLDASLEVAVEAIEASYAATTFRDGRVVMPRGDVAIVRGRAFDTRMNDLPSSVYAIFESGACVRGVHGLPLPGDAGESTLRGFIVRLTTSHLARGVHRFHIAALTADAKRYVRGNTLTLEVA